MYVHLELYFFHWYVTYVYELCQRSRTYCFLFFCWSPSEIRLLCDERVELEKEEREIDFLGRRLRRVFSLRLWLR